MSDMALREYEDGFYAVPANTVDDEHNPTAPEGAIFLDDDEDNAPRVFALRAHLDDWTSRIEVDSGHYLRVNERRERHGMSFEDAAADIGVLRRALDQTKWVTFGPFGNYTAGVGGDMTLAQLLTIGRAPGAPGTLSDLSDTYDCISHAIRKEAPEMLKEGIHTVLNTLYHITKGYDEKQWHCRLLRALWQGKDIEDTRTYYVKVDSEYLVLTGEEANVAWNENLDSYIDGCMEIPKHIKPYFDRERWKSEARIDGRGHSLSGYDGMEHSVKVAGVTYFLYRNN